MEAQESQITGKVPVGDFEVMAMKKRKGAMKAVLMVAMQSDSWAAGGETLGDMVAAMLKDMLA